MPSAPGGPARERLAQRHPVRFRVDLDAVTAAQPLQGHLLVGLAQAPQDDLAGVRVLFEAQGGVLRDQPGQALRQSVLVRLAVRPYGQRKQRVRRRPGLDQDRVAGRGERVAGLRLAEPGHARQIARDAPVQRVLPAAERGGERPDADLRLVAGARGVPRGVQAVAAQMHRVVGAQGAGEDADQGDAAHVRVGGRLDDLGDQRAVGVADRRGPGLARGGGDDGRGAFQRGREAAGDQLQQFDGADALAGALGRGGGREDGVEGAPGDGAFQIGGQGRDADVLAVEVAVHQGLVLALGDDPLDQPVAGLTQWFLLAGRGRELGAFAGGVVQDPPAQQSGEAGQRGVPVGRLGTRHGQVQRQYGVGVVAPEGLGADPGHVVEGGAGGVQMRDDDRARHADERALLPGGPGGRRHRLGLLRRRDDEEGRVRRAQTGPQLPDEVRVAGGVQQIDLAPVPGHRNQREPDGTPAALLDLVVVGDGRPVLDQAGPVHGPRRQGQGLDQGGLARSAGADQHHVPYGGGVAGRRCSSGGSGVCVCLVAHGACLPVDGAVRGRATAREQRWSRGGEAAAAVSATPAVLRAWHRGGTSSTARARAAASVDRAPGAAGPGG
ncbi:hypothetical protein SBADM41S_05065 [Streptomyces badius]